MILQPIKTSSTALSKKSCSCSIFNFATLYHFNIYISYEILRIHLHFVQQLQKILQRNSAGCSRIVHSLIATTKLVTQAVSNLVTSHNNIFTPKRKQHQVWMDSNAGSSTQLNTGVSYFTHVQARSSLLPQAILWWGEHRFSTTIFKWM